MNWLCGECGQAPATTLYLLWMWRSATDLGARQSRWVAYRCELLCDGCAERENDPSYHRNPDEQFIPVGLTARTKGDLLKQVLAQVIGKARGYVPKTDLQKAISKLTPDRGGRRT